MRVYPAWLKSWIILATTMPLAAGYNPQHWRAASAKLTCKMPQACIAALRNTTSSRSCRGGLKFRKHPLTQTCCGNQSAITSKNVCKIYLGTQLANACRSSAGVRSHEKDIIQKRYCRNRGKPAKSVQQSKFQAPEKNEPAQQAGSCCALEALGIRVRAAIHGFPISVCAALSRGGVCHYVFRESRSAVANQGGEPPAQGAIASTP